MLADQTRSLIKDCNFDAYVAKIDKCPTVPEIVSPTVTAINELASEILTNLYLYLWTVENLQEVNKELAEDLG
jgi:hypothetical protein